MSKKPPRVVVIALALMTVSGAGNIISDFAFGFFDANRYTPALASVDTVVRGALVIGLVLLVLTGHNWARWLFVVTALASGYSPVLWLVLPDLGSLAERVTFAATGAMGVASALFLLTPAASRWFKERRSAATLGSVAGSVSARAEWLYLDGAIQRGPIGESELRGRIRLGEIDSDSLVWREGMGEWGKASEVLPRLTSAST